MMHARLCSWCRTPNPFARYSCARCGHDAHKVPLRCTCVVCQEPKVKESPIDANQLSFAFVSQVPTIYDER